MPRKWTLQNPHELPMVVTLHSDGTTVAEFPALGDCKGMAWDRDPWVARDKAILACAEAMVAKFKVGRAANEPRTECAA